MTTKNKIALLFISLGLVTGIALSFLLHVEKLAIAIAGPAALMATGLTQWSSTNEKHKNKIALIFITSGLAVGIALSFALHVEKLAIAMGGPAALMGAGLAQWSSTNGK
ncbi:hypothetical protein [Microcystis aeruginosa]|uniref:Uncharacterized protein n=1 Tax=Microcystis aeruginosa NIES-3787 TaxID=2517782 RepID=A0A6H9FYH2_MICAE|nr:hypothetical protein [Microcystis aeruginosa]GCL48258.1 hypothetical protein NIES3787_39740 [Microcystis aeruginosa NIES-3787]